MTSFTIQSLTALLSWVASAAKGVWTFFTQPEAGPFVQWLITYWKELLALLLALGVFADLTVYLLRWQPWKVWASFIRRHRGKGTSAAAPSAADEEKAPRQSAAQDSAARRAKLRLTALLDKLTEEEPSEITLPYRAPMRSAEEAYHDPYIPEARRAENSFAPARRRRTTIRGQQ